MAEIPRIIHQTWKSAEPPPEWAPLVQSWRTHHPGWQHRIWTDLECRAFVAERLPRLLPTYDAYPYAILRADAFRYAVLLEEGGLYVDMDVECLRPIDQLLEGARCVLTLEPRLHGAWHGRVDLVSNAFMAAAPRQPLFAAFVDELPRRELDTGLHVEVLSTTGPLMLDDVVRSREWPELTLLPSTTVAPLVSAGDDLAELRIDGARAEAIRAQARKAGSYGIHYWSNSWVRNLAGDLNNPDPYAVPGFRFFQGVDSVGNDIGNGGRDIPALAGLCSAHADAVAFNTDGFLKHSLLDPSLWARILDAGEDEGLYVTRTRGRARSTIARLFHKQS